MKRNEHLFQFTGRQISAAAERESAYHAERLTWWKLELEEATNRAKETGVQLREYDVTGGKRVQMVVDTEVQNRLAECGTKIDAHRKARDEFMIHAQVYNTQSERTYELAPDDVLYFRLAWGTPEL